MTDRTPPDEPLLAPPISRRDLYQRILARTREDRLVWTAHDDGGFFTHRATGNGQPFELAVFVSLLPVLKIEFVSVTYKFWAWRLYRHLRREYKARKRAIQPAVFRMFDQYLNDLISGAVTRLERWRNR